MSRIPTTCPYGFKGRYIVQPGDTMYLISQMFRTRLEDLIENNRHISNQNYLLPGDILCVPSLVTIPCCIVLNNNVPIPFGNGGAAFVNFGPQGSQAVSIIATLPPPSTFGDYDIYISTIFLKDIGGFGNQLFPTNEYPPTWSARVDIPTVAFLSPNSRIVVMPSNSTSGLEGPIILNGTLTNCDKCTV